MFVFDCEAGYQPDNGQNDVTDGSVENYDFDWGQPLNAEPLDDALTGAKWLDLCRIGTRGWRGCDRLCAGRHDPARDCPH